MSGLIVWGDAFGSGTSAEIVHALDMAAACRGVARALRRAGEESAAAAFAANAKGFTFRAREIRYNANGGRVPPGGWP